MENWCKRHPKYKELQVFISWGNWRCRDLVIFYNQDSNISILCTKTLTVLFDYLKKKEPKGQGISPFPLFLKFFLSDILMVFTKGKMWRGNVLHINRDHSFHVWFSCGHGENTKVKLLSLWGHLLFPTRCGVISLQVVGDSHFIIEWVTCKATL